MCNKLKKISLKVNDKRNCVLTSCDMYNHWWNCWSKTKLNTKLNVYSILEILVSPNISDIYASKHLNKFYMKFTLKKQYLPWKRIQELHVCVYNNFLCCQYFCEFGHHSAMGCLYRTGDCGQQSLPSDNQKTSLKLKLLTYLPSDWDIIQLQFYDFYICFGYYHLVWSALDTSK